MTEENVPHKKRDDDEDPIPAFHEIISFSNSAIISVYCIFTPSQVTVLSNNKSTMIGKYFWRFNGKSFVLIKQCIYKIQK